MSGLLTMLYISKSIFHSGRPYLDNIKLGDLTMNEHVSAEFGMPSGHGISISTHLVFWLRYYTEVREAVYYVQNPKQVSRLYRYAYLLIMAVCYSRVYVGRHTFDQVIIGACMGLWNVSFTFEVIKPYLYDVSLRAENKSK